MTTADSRFDLIYREGVAPEKVVGKKVPLPEYARYDENGLVIERNVSVRVRDDVRIFIDIYRPRDPVGLGELPILLGWSPYGKHNTAARLPWPEADVAPGWISPYTAFEAPDPLYWCSRGYAVVYPDPRGSWYSQGELRHGGLGEARDCYDLIGWLGEQPWSNGKVGMSGVSYLTTIQWQVAPLRPRHLAAINPWEGFTDWYRELAYHGGIPETSFLVRGCANLQWSTTRVEDTVANARAHPLYDAYWRSKECALEDIQVPAYVVASWSDQGLHTRGTLEGYKRIGSREKWLEVHGRKKWHYYYRPESVEKQRVFFDHFLKQRDHLVPAWPKVLIEVRKRANVGELRAEHEWPLARTQLGTLYLHADGLLETQPRAASSSIAYDARFGSAVFDYILPQAAEVTGSMKLRLWVQADGSDDMDLFVAVQKLDRTGRSVPFVFYSLHENGPVALGWLRASHRELDERRSRPEQPFHSHVREQRLLPGEVVPLEIEIWPSSTSFAAGERLRVVVQGHDINVPAVPGAPVARHEATRNEGRHVIHMGGRFDSHLVVPWIPAVPVLSEADYREYIAAFNRSDFDAFSRFYAANVEFQGRAGRFEGREAVVGFYRGVHARLRETLEIQQLVMGDQELVADVVTQLEALEDWPDFPTGPLFKGDVLRSQNFIWYELSGREFARVRAAHYRRGNFSAEAAPSPPCSTGDRSLSREEFMSYIDAFNRNDYAGFADYYAPVVRLVIAGKHELIGREAILELYRSVKATTRRTINVKRLIITGCAIAAELESEFLALEDLPDFTAGPLRKAERLFINTVVLYDLADGKFSRIRSAELRKRRIVGESS